MKALSKGSSTNPTVKTPSLVRGSLFAGPSNQSRIYSFGGSDSYENVNFPNWVGPTSDQFPLWSYEYTSTDWGAYDLSSNHIIRPASGAYAEAPDLGLAFWYNGQRDSGSSTAAQPLNGTIDFMKGMIVIDFNTETAKNISTDAVSDQPRVRGKMVYVPTIGVKGALILIGGGEKGSGYNNGDWHGTPVSLIISWGQIELLLTTTICIKVPMDQIYIFDVASLDDPATPNGTWYQQKASGSIPQPRLDHCLVLVSSQDGSSQNMYFYPNHCVKGRWPLLTMSLYSYMYGGRDASNNYFDDGKSARILSKLRTKQTNDAFVLVYVLSLPSFSWINIYTGDSPRYAMTCHLVGNRQMITVGGGTQAAINRDCDWETKGVAIYDLSTLLWGSVFTHDAPPYEVPKPIINVIGGTHVSPYPLFGETVLTAR